MERPAFTIWFTGLPRCGKMAIARVVQRSLQDRGVTAEVLNSAKIRKQFSQGLGYSRSDIETSVRRLIYECSLLNRNGITAVVSAVSPYRDMREAARETLDRFFEVYCRASLEVLESRDETGLFERARRGEIENVAGVNAPFEAPEHADAVLDTDAVDPDGCAGRILDALALRGFISQVDSAAYTTEEEETIRNRLRDLGYL